MNDRTITIHDYTIPDELKSLAQWVLWEPIARGGKIAKIPINPNTKKKASSTQRSTWGTFAAVLEAYQAAGGAYGIGFVFTADDPYSGIDLDNCIGEQGELADWAAELVDELGSYTELSPSGKGLHIVVRGKLPGTGTRHKGIEVYDKGRYFTVTGESWGEPKPVVDAQEAVDCLCARLKSGGPAGGVRVNGVHPPAEMSAGGLPAGGAASCADINIIVDPNAQPPLAKFEALKANRNFKLTWDHKRGGEAKGWSPSEYDMAIARFAANEGWSDQEIVDLLIYHRRENGLDKIDRLDYYQRTIFNLGEASATERTLEAIEAGRDVKREAVIEVIESLIGLRLHRWVQYGDDPAQYALWVYDIYGEIRERVIPTSKQVREQGTWQDIAQELLGVAFTPLSRVRWKKFLVCLGRIREYEAGEANRQTHEMREALIAFGRSGASGFSSHLTRCDQVDYDAIRLGGSFVDDSENVLYFKLAEFKSWLWSADGKGHAMAEAGMNARFCSAGAKNLRLRKRDPKSKKRAEGHYWKFPFGDDGSTGEDSELE